MNNDVLKDKRKIDMMKNKSENSDKSNRNDKQIKFYEYIHNIKETKLKT